MHTVVALRVLHHTHESQMPEVEKLKMQESPQSTAVESELDGSEEKCHRFETGTCGYWAYATLTLASPFLNGNKKLWSRWLLFLSSFVQVLLARESTIRYNI